MSQIQTLAHADSRDVCERFPLFSGSSQKKTSTYWIFNCDFQWTSLVCFSLQNYGKPNTVKQKEMKEIFGEGR